MTKLLSDLENLSQLEYLNNIDDKGELNNSDHESYALILEEFQEAQVEFNAVEYKLNNLWECIKTDESDEVKSAHIKELYEPIIRCTAELIQMAGLCHKANNTVRHREEE